MSKNYTVISDLDKKVEIEDSNLIIVEDNEDTKQSTVSDLKKAFTGDYKNPSDMTFYSSNKIESYMNDIRRELSTFASDKDVKSLERRLESIVASAGDDNTEIVEARDGLGSLKSRLTRDINFADDKYLEKIRKFIEGKVVSTGNCGYVDIYVNNMSGATANLILKSKNWLNIKANTNTSEVEYTSTGFKYTQKSNTNLAVSLKFANSVPKGKYYFFTNIIYDAIFKDTESIKLAVRNSRDDSAYTEFTYNQTGKFEFEAPKAFDEIKIIYNKDNFITNAVTEFKNIMLVEKEEYGKSYIPYYYQTVPVENGTYIEGYNADYDISCSDDTAIVRVEYYDKAITTETIQNDIDELKSVVIDNRDKCGLIENYGDYLFFDKAVCETPTACRVSYDNDKFMRNGVPSLKAEFVEDVDINPVFAMELDKYVENIDSVSLVFYIDRTTSYFFTTETPITIRLCSDSYREPEMVNYLSTTVNKNELVQGWNIIKRNINQFTATGLPNSHAIKYTKVEVAKNQGLDNLPIYFNALIFNQKLKPTVLLAFDGIYEDGVNYTYPYLASRGIPATILSNNRTTYSSTILNKVVDLRARYGWDLGQYGCNPNKELLTNDDNAREQYLALKASKEWLKDNLVYNPVSYSAPYGNLRPITVPLLKDLGYKIAKTDSNGYCNFFDPDYDFAIPMVLMSNNLTKEEVIEKIQYAIDNECCICIYTNNVTEYGDELNVKKATFEEVIKFILENDNKIKAMTFADFYNKCNS